MPKPPDRYHHGALRAALLEAGEAVLAEKGVEGFSLRDVARRVGVSHSAPAHHFGDAQGLLAALAAEGFRRFLGAMQVRQAEAPDDPRERLLASGLGYLDFAESAPALFQLMFASRRVDRRTEELEAAGAAAFQHLVEDVARVRGAPPPGDAEASPDVLACWSIVHGLAELMLAGRLQEVEALSPGEREALFRSVIRRALP